MKNDDILNQMSNKGPAYTDAKPVPGRDLDEAVLTSFKSIVAARRSIRIFDGVALPEKTMESILADTTLSPSSSNLQPWEFYWIRDPEKKQAAAEACLGQPAAKTAGDLLALVARPDLWDTNRLKLIDIMTQGGKTELPKPVNIYYKKLIPRLMATDPFGVQNLFRRILFSVLGLTKVMVRSPKNKGDHRVWAHTQVALAAQTLMLSAAAHGYDSCPMGGFDEVRMRKILNLPSGAEVTMMMAVGNRKPEGLYGPQIRLSQADVVHKV